MRHGVPGDEGKVTKEPVDARHAVVVRGGRGEIQRVPISRVAIKGNRHRRYIVLRAGPLLQRQHAARVLGNCPQLIVPGRCNRASAEQDHLPAQSVKDLA